MKIDGKAVVFITAIIFDSLYSATIHLNSFFDAIKAIFKIIF